MDKIDRYTPLVHDGLERFLEDKRTGGGATRWHADVLERLAPFVTNGKLLRGSLVCFAYEMFAHAPADKPVIRTAMALELAHSGLLVHDDIMDDDPLRRGKPSFHQQYRSLGAHEELAHEVRFGSNMAICAGDAALFMAFELLAGCPAPAVRLFTEQLVVTCAGQMHDLYLEANPALPSKQAIYELMETKTASYTLALPLTLGASLAGRSGKTLERLRDTGMKAGIIFQIRDDELGVMGDTEDTGKPVGSDIIEGKKTLLYYYLLQACSRGERQKIITIFGNRAATAEDIGYVRSLVVERGISASLHREINALEKQAATIINGLDVLEKNKGELMELIRFCGRRHA
ncbi:MAG TPA: polyprenyl synthetase family protein [Candidatus Saccharimonadales bacterium]|nr:polyprenyl synthetase family protein [Candidatus Saccharimonadales bacterium]